MKTLRYIKEHTLYIPNVNKYVDFYDYPVTYALEGNETDPIAFRVYKPKDVYLDLEIYDRYIKALPVYLEVTRDFLQGGMSYNQYTTRITQELNMYLSAPVVHALIDLGMNICYRVAKAIKEYLLEYGLSNLSAGIKYSRDDGKLKAIMPPRILADLDADDAQPDAHEIAMLNVKLVSYMIYHGYIYCYQSTHVGSCSDDFVEEYYFYMYKGAAHPLILTDDMEAVNPAGERQILHQAINPYINFAPKELYEWQLNALTGGECVL